MASRRSFSSVSLFRITSRRCLSVSESISSCRRYWKDARLGGQRREFPPCRLCRTYAYSEYAARSHPLAWLHAPSGGKLMPPATRSASPETLANGAAKPSGSGMGASFRQFSCAAHGMAKRLTARRASMARWSVGTSPAASRLPRGNFPGAPALANPCAGQLPNGERPLFWHRPNPGPNRVRTVRAVPCPIDFPCHSLRTDQTLLPAC